MKRLWAFVKWVLIVLVLLNLLIVVSGNFYLYTVFQNTIFKGRLGPAIDEYEIFASREVPANNPLPWPEARNYQQNKPTAEHLARLEELKTVAYLIIKDDSLCFEKYWEGYGPTSHSNSFSMAKSIVGALVGVAIQEGHINSLDQPVGDFLPEFKEGDKGKITLRHLLTMSSGIGFGESYINPLSYPARANYGTNLRELVFSYDAENEPGVSFVYSSGNSQLLSFVLKAATGKSVSEYAAEKLWGPIGAESPALWSLDTEGGEEKAFCCFNSNARDFARMGQLYLNGGSWNGRQILPLDYVAWSVVPAPLTEKTGEPQGRYGLHWWIIEYNGQQVFYMRGLSGQYVLVVPDKRMVVVRLGHKRDRPPGALHPKDVSDWLDIAMALYGES